MSKWIGPFQISLHIHLLNESTNQIGNVEFSLAPARLPTLDDVHEAIGAAIAAVPEGFRLLSGDEFFNKVLVKEKYGRAGNFATDHECDYNVNVLTAAARAAHAAKRQRRRRSSSHGEEE